MELNTVLAWVGIPRDALFVTWDVLFHPGLVYNFQPYTILVTFLGYHTPDVPRSLRCS
jgi:hypothetical protein